MITNIRWDESKERVRWECTIPTLSHPETEEEIERWEDAWDQVCSDLRAWAPTFPHGEEEFYYRYLVRVKREYGATFIGNDSTGEGVLNHVLLESLPKDEKGGRWSLHLPRVSKKMLTKIRGEEDNHPVEVIYYHKQTYNIQYHPGGPVIPCSDDEHLLVRPTFPERGEWTDKMDVGEVIQNLRGAVKALEGGDSTTATQKAGIALLGMNAPFPSFRYNR
jgi:hypothetical protein